jgi:peptidyl-prolyl cis-trans isomerase SurA
MKQVQESAMNKLITTSGLLLTVLVPLQAQLASSHSSTQAPMPASVSTQLPALTPVAKVNGAVLTERDLKREEYTIFPYAKQHNGNIPKEMEPGIRKGAMQMIIFEELCYQEAARRGMTVPATKLQKAKNDFLGQFSTKAEYQQFMQYEFQGDEAKLTDKIKRSMLIDSFLKSEVASKSVVTVAELKAFYEKNSKRFEYPESFAVQTISFVPPQKATPQQLQEARKRAQETLPKAKATKSYEEFGLLAEKVSEDDYRVMMGAHKPTDRAELAPQMVEALLKLQAGRVTDIIQVEQIFTIVRLNKHIPAGKQKFVDVQAEIKKEVQQAKTNQLRTALDRKLRQNAQIEVL